MSYRIDHLALTFLAAIGVALLSIPAGAQMGGGGGGGGVMPTPERGATPNERAAKSYEEGERARERALAYEEEARESDEKGFFGLGSRPSEKAEEQWRKAATAFQKAAKTAPPRYAKAYTDVCVAHLELGEPEKALAAADRALERRHLDHAPAVACRGGTRRELGRSAAARGAGGSLNSRDQALANELMQSMKAWLDRNEREPAVDVPSESLEDFRVWMLERGGLARR